MIQFAFDLVVLKSSWVYWLNLYKSVPKDTTSFFITPVSPNLVAVLVISAKMKVQ